MPVAELNDDCSSQDKQQSNEQNLSTASADGPESQPTSEKENKNTQKTTAATEMVIKDLFEAYNIDCEDLDAIYKDTEEIVSEREKILSSQMLAAIGGGNHGSIIDTMKEKDHISAVTTQPNGLSPQINFPWSAEQNGKNVNNPLDFWSNFNSPEKCKNLDMSDALSGLKGSPSYLPCSGSVYSSSSLLQKMPSGTSMSSATVSAERGKQLSTGAEITEKSLFINLALKQGHSAANWDKFTPFESDKVNGDNLERCVDCGAAYTTSSALFYHVRRKAKSSASKQSLSSSSSSLQMLQCKKCVLPITNECAQKAHQRLHFLTAPYVCFICGLRCASDMRLLHHIDGHGVECRVQNNIACHTCQLVFISKEHLVKHREAAHHQGGIVPSGANCINSTCITALGTGAGGGMNPAIESIVNGPPKRPSSNNTSAAAYSVHAGRTSHAHSQNPQSTAVIKMSPPPSRPNSLGKQNEATALAVKSSEKAHVMGIQGSKPLRMEKLPSEKNGKHAVNTSTSGSSGSTFPQLNGATAAGTGPGTKCHLCQKVLSRRDKLKWHLAICCPRFHVDLYDQLLVAGFAHAIAKNVVLGSNCAAKCQFCSRRFTSRASLELHESTCSLKTTLGFGSSQSGTDNKKGVPVGPKDPLLPLPTDLSLSSSSTSSGTTTVSSSANGLSLLSSESNNNNNIKTGGQSQNGGQQTSSGVDRLTCHLCNRTLSRRDKLKRHLVRCCETHQRDVEIALLVAGFTAKDVEKVLSGSISGLPQKCANNVSKPPAAPPLRQTSPPIITDQSTCSIVSTTDKKEEHTVEKESENESGFFEVSAMGGSSPPSVPMKYHQLPELIPEPPSFPADLSDVTPVMSPACAKEEFETKSNSGGGGVGQTMSNSQSCSPSGCLLPTSLSSLLVEVSPSSSSATPSGRSGVKNKSGNNDEDHSPTVSVQNTTNSSAVEKSDKRSNQAEQPNAVAVIGKRPKHRCESCGEVFIDNLVFSLHSCT